MNEFTFDKGTRICKIVDSKLKSENGTEIFVYDKDFKCCIHCGDKCTRVKPCCVECSKFTYHKKTKKEFDLDKLYEIIKSVQGIEDDFDFSELEDDNKALVGNGISKTHMKLKSGRFQIVPTNNINDPDTYLIVGKAGSGKSFLIAQYLQQFKIYYPKYRIYLFSQKTSDKHLDSFITKRIPLDKIGPAQFTVDDFKNTLVIFDDIDTIDDKEVNKATFALLQMILEVGRSNGIFTIMTSHLATDREKTKRILNRCTAFIFFKKSSGRNTTYCLEEYMGFTHKEAKALYKIDTFAYCIFRMAPQIICCQGELLFQPLLVKEKE